MGMGIFFSSSNDEPEEEGGNYVVSIGEVSNSSFTVNGKGFTLFGSDDDDED